MLALEPHRVPMESVESPHLPARVPVWVPALILALVPALPLMSLLALTLERTLVQATGLPFAVGHSLRLEVQTSSTHVQTLQVAMTVFPGGARTPPWLEVMMPWNPTPATVQYRHH